MSSYVRLELCAPLVYIKQPYSVSAWTNQTSCENVDANSENCVGSETVFCFELDSVQGKSIEPDRRYFSGTLLFYGVPALDSQGFGSMAETIQVPAGAYLFTQKNEVLNKDECIELAMEQQKDGLWDKLKLHNLLYVRFLFEDNRRVTQIFRPLAV